MCLTIVEYLQPLTSTTPARRNSRVGKGALFYSVRIDEDELLETEKFFRNMRLVMEDTVYVATFEAYNGITPKDALDEFLRFINRMRKTGLEKKYFKDENAAFRIFPNPDTPFRVFALRWNNFAILGNGGIKFYNKPTLQENSHLIPHYRLMIDLGKKIQHRGLTFCDDYFDCDEDDFCF
jgi:hypothetical protein